MNSGSQNRNLVSKTSKLRFKYADIRIFVLIMCIVIGVQGTYLGYIVGVQTSIERRFEISSYDIGLLLSMYDVGHTISVVLVGYFGAEGHKPRWTAIGALLSSVAMLGLTIPNFAYGPTSFEENFENHKQNFIDATKCSPERSEINDNSYGRPICEKHSHMGAFAILVISQLIAGFAAAPFNTLAYVYIDDNVQDRRNSPFYLGNILKYHVFYSFFVNF